jgi:hypothetical protein
VFAYVSDSSQITKYVFCFFAELHCFPFAATTKTPKLPLETAKHCAYHDAGHAVFGWFVKGMEPPDKVIKGQPWLKASNKMHMYL